MKKIPERRINFRMTENEMVTLMYILQNRDNIICKEVARRIHNHFKREQGNAEQRKQKELIDKHGTRMARFKEGKTWLVGDELRDFVKRTRGK